MKATKNWIIKNRLTVLFYVMIWVTYYLYKEGAGVLVFTISYILTIGIARTEGGYVESFKTDFFYKTCISLIEGKSKIK